MSSPKPLEHSLREAVARIIDPNSWARFENRCRTSNWQDWPMFRKRYCGPSLAKADQILALPEALLGASQSQPGCDAPDGAASASAELSASPAFSREQKEQAFGLIEPGAAMELEEIDALRRARRASVSAEPSAAFPLSDAQIKHMVNRFLGWRLPEDFAPDCGITFDADAARKLNPRNLRFEPVGTNLLSSTQAEAMVRYIAEWLS